MTKPILTFTACVSFLLSGVAVAGQVGDPAPPLKVNDWIKRGPVDYDAQAAQIQVIEFWATWCPHCIESIPHLNQLQSKYASAGVSVIGITDEPASVVRRFASKVGAQMNYAIALDEKRVMWNAYMGAFGIDAIPHAFIVDRNGVIAWHGNPLSGEIDSALASVVANQPMVPQPAITTPMPVQPPPSVQPVPLPRPTPLPSAPAQPVPHQMMPLQPVPQPDLGAPPMAQPDFMPPPVMNPVPVHPGQKPKLPDVEIEIDSLDAEIYGLGDTWKLAVEYEVETEGFNDAIELALHLREKHCGLVNDAGEPLIFRIPLLQPEDPDDDELEYSGEVVFPLPPTVFRNPNRLHVIGDIVRTGHLQSLANKRESVDYDNPCRRGRVSVGVCGVGVNVCW